VDARPGRGWVGIIQRQLLAAGSPAAVSITNPTRLPDRIRGRAHRR